MLDLFFAAGDTAHLVLEAGLHRFQMNSTLLGTGTIYLVNNGEMEYQGNRTRRERIKLIKPIGNSFQVPTLVIAGGGATLNAIQEMTIRSLSLSNGNLRGSKKGNFPTWYWLSSI
jgi:hypothetical protein